MVVIQRRPIWSRAKIHGPSQSRPRAFFVPWTTFPPWSRSLFIRPFRHLRSLGCPPQYQTIYLHLILTRRLKWTNASFLRHTKDTVRCLKIDLLLRLFDNSICIPKRKIFQSPLCWPMLLQIIAVQKKKWNIVKNFCYINVFYRIRI